LKLSISSFIPPFYKFFYTIIFPSLCSKRLVMKNSKQILRQLLEYVNPEIPKELEPLARNLFLNKVFQIQINE